METSFPSGGAGEPALADTLSVRAFVDSMPLAYARAFDEPAIFAHAGIVQRRGGRACHVEAWRDLPERTVAMCVVAVDSPGLLAKISAALLAHDMDVVAAQIYCRMQRGRETEAVDFFWIRRYANASGSVPAIRATDVAAIGETLTAMLEKGATIEDAIRMARLVPQ